MADFELHVWQQDGQLAARIHCDAFVDNEDGFASFDDVYAWAMARTAKSPDPFVYVE